MTGEGLRAQAACALDVAGRVCRGGCRFVPCLPAVVQDLCRYLGRRGPGAAGLGHAARELAAARLDHGRRDVLHDGNPRVRAHRAVPGPARRCRPHRGRCHLHAAGAGGRAAGQGPRDRAGRADPAAGRGGDHARAPVRERHAPAAVAAGSPGHPAPAAAYLPDAGPRAAALVCPGRGRGGAHRGGDRRPGGRAGRGRPARRWSAPPVSCWPYFPGRAARACGSASRWPRSGSSCPWWRRACCRSWRPRSPCG